MTDRAVLIHRLEESAKEEEAAADAFRFTVPRWAEEHAERAALLREAAKALRDTKEG